MAKDPSRSVSIHGDKYTYDKDKNKWMSGKKEATPATSAMLDMILHELGPEGEEEVESFVGTADIVSGGGQEETPEAEQAKEEARERKEEAQENMEESPPDTEAEKEQEVAEAVKPSPIPTDSVTLPKPEMPEGEVAVKQLPPADQPRTVTEKLKQDFGRNFKTRINESLPYTRLFTDTTDRKAKEDESVFAPLTDSLKNIKEMFADRKNWFKEREVIEKRESLDKLTDLKPEEIKRLEERGIAPASEDDFSYRKEGKPLSKEDILQELNQDADERNAQPEPFYKRRFKQLKGEFKENFKERLNENLPYMRLFTDKLDPSKKSDAEQVAADGISVADAGMGDTTVADSLKSIDNNIQQIVGILKGQNEHEQKDDKKADAEEVEEDAYQQEAAKDVVVEAQKQKDASQLEKMVSEAEIGEPPAADEGDGGFSYELGKKSRRGINKLKEGFGKIKEKFSFGKKAAPEAAAAEGVDVAEAAAPAVAAEGAAVAEGVSAAEGITGSIGAAGAGAAAAEGGGMLSGLMRFLPKLALKDGGVVNKMIPFTAFADGGVVNKMIPFTAFADGGVVNNPTPFAHEGGLGVMGEAGPEAVMPLQRGSDGKLGVKVQSSELPDALGVTKDADPSKVEKIESGSQMVDASETKTKGGKKSVKRKDAFVDYVKSTNEKTGETESFVDYRADGKAKTREEFEKYLKKNPEIAEKIKKSGIMEQTKGLTDSEAERRRRKEEKDKKSGAAGATIVNNNTTNNTNNGGSGAMIPTGGARNSLDLNYFAQ